MKPIIKHISNFEDIIKNRQIPIEDSNYIFEIDGKKILLEGVIFKSITHEDIKNDDLE